MLLRACVKVLEETVTVQRLAISGLLRKTLSTTMMRSNPPLTSCVIKYPKRKALAKRQHGEALGGVRRPAWAETRFRRIKGYRDMPMASCGIRRLTVESSQDLR